MTNEERKALVERLRKEDEWTNQRPYFHAHDKSLQAADLIETQAREIERLREALEGLLHMWSSRTVEAARAALAGDSHDQ